MPSVYSPAEQPIIGGNEVLYSLENRGQYHFTLKAVRNGLGINTRVGAGSATWRFEYMTRAEYDWWASTLLGNVPSKLFTTGTIQLWDDSMTIKTWRQVVVDRPTYETYQNGIFRDVMVNFTAMILT